MVHEYIIRVLPEVAANEQRLIDYLVKEKGMKIEAACAEINRNRDNVSKRIEVIDKLRKIRDQLIKLKTALDSIRFDR